MFDLYDLLLTEAVLIEIITETKKYDYFPSDIFKESLENYFEAQTINSELK